ncbi:arylsulfatase B-like [Watersipora subatra]|uniref:arylsulfatase B-like n=1 Tax=Watersipora subatra TaxID=2589382 RepID=UPI00355C90B1
MRLLAAFLWSLLVRSVEAQDECDINSSCDSYRDRYRDRPNIIYIMADDLGWNDVGFHNPKIKTPHIDALKAKGIELTQAYMEPVCSASRSAFMTGRYSTRNGLQLLVLMQASQSCLPVEHKTIHQYMREEGYSTTHIGKWHLGDCSESCLPLNRGVEEFRGILSGEADYFNWTDRGVMQRNINGEPSIKDIGTHLTIQDMRDVREIIVNQSMQSERKPFFMWLATTAPHIPLQATEEMFNVHNFLNASNPAEKNRRTYLGIVSALDDLVGTTISALRETRLHKNTIIVFSSDNGGPTQASAYLGKPYYSNNYPLRNSKMTFMEGGIRVPTIYYDPRLCSSTRGTSRDFMIHVTDWLPTFLQIAKEETNSENFTIPGIDGVSQLANLGSKYNCPAKRKYNLREEFVIALTERTVSTRSFCAMNDTAYRWRDYKLVYGKRYYMVDPDTVNSEWPVPQESPELPEIIGSNCHRVEDGERVVRCLFNVIEDPSETDNLFDKEPEVVEMLLNKISEAKKVSVKPVHHRTLGVTNITAQVFGDYLIPKHDYCTPSQDFPLEAASSLCY